MRSILGVFFIDVKIPVIFLSLLNKIGNKIRSSLMERNYLWKVVLLSYDLCQDTWWDERSLKSNPPTRLWAVLHKLGTFTWKSASLFPFYSVTICSSCIFPPRACWTLSHCLKSQEAGTGDLFCPSSLCCDPWPVGSHSVLCFGHSPTSLSSSSNSYLLHFSSLVLVTAEMF